MRALPPSAAQPFKRLRYSVRGLANWILDLAERHGFVVTNMALNKLIFFAIERVLVENGALLTEARIEAWDHGPVFREVYHSFKKNGDNPIRDRVSFYSVDTQRLEKSSVELPAELSHLLEETLLPLLPMSASRLRNLSHVEGGAWHQVWCYDGYANPGMEITPELILSAASAEGLRDHGR
jgi:uncharacterized phage-associated protein